MDLPSLMRQLTADDPAQRQAAGDALVAIGEPAVAPLLAECLRGSAALHARDDATRRTYYAAKVYVDVLRRVGDPAFGPLVRAIAAGEHRAEISLACDAFEQLAVSDPAVYLQTLAHSQPHVRRSTLRAFTRMGAGALPYAPQVVPLIGDPAESVRASAVNAVKAMGPEVMPLLRRIRRSAAPYRRQALVALAELGGWDALDEIDKRLVHRLINIKIGHEVPEPMHLCGTWYAVRTADQAAVLDAFGLSGAVPVTMRLGEAAWSSSTHGASDGSLAYVTPVLHGWTLVFGELSAHGTWDEAIEGMAALSSRFGAAHCYYTFEGTTAWCIAENGRLVRSYHSECPDEQVGPPHPAEDGFLLPHIPRLPEEDMAYRVDGAVALFRRVYFDGEKVGSSGPHPLDEMDRDAIPPAFQAEVDEFVRFFGLAGTGRDWYPDLGFTDVALFDQMTNRFTRAVVATGRMEQVRQRLATRTCDAMDVAARASVNPEALGPRVRVEGHAVLARSGEPAGSALSGIGEALPI